MSGPVEASDPAPGHYSKEDRGPEPEFAVYLRTVQGWEHERHRAWRRNVIALWRELRAMGVHANRGLLGRVERLGNRGPLRRL